LFRNTNAASFLTDRRGAIAVEFAITSVFILIFIFFLTDLVMREGMSGRLDRVSYSVAGVMRERTQLFDARESWTNQDTEETWQLAYRMLHDMDPDADLSKMTIAVNSMSFSPPGNQNDYSKPTIYYSQGRKGALSTAQCEVGNSLWNVAELTPRGSFGRWVPMKAIVVCLPVQSWFSKLWSLAGQPPVMKSTSMVILR